MLNSKRRLIMLLVLILLILPTGCKTIENTYVPEIILPVIDEQPTHESWNFVFNEETGDYTISKEGLQAVVKYISDLKVYGLDGWDWVQYVKDETARFREKYLDIDQQEKGL